MIRKNLFWRVLRFQDGDISVKSGSVLAFCGLIIATSIVQLTASSDSYIFILKDSFSWYINGVGLMLLFLSAGVCLRALTVSPSYSKDGKERSTCSILYFMYLAKEACFFLCETNGIWLTLCVDFTFIEYSVNN